MKKIVQSQISVKFYRKKKMEKFLKKCENGLTLRPLCDKIPAHYGTRTATHSAHQYSIKHRGFQQIFVQMLAFLHKTVERMGKIVAVLVQNI